MKPMEGSSRKSRCSTRWKRLPKNSTQLLMPYMPKTKSADATVLCLWTKRCKNNTHETVVNKYTNRVRKTEKREERREGGREGIFLTHTVGMFFCFPLLGPKELAHGWHSNIFGPKLRMFFSLLFGSSKMSARSLRSNFVFPLIWASHFVGAKLDISCFLFPCLWASHF